MELNDAVLHNRPHEADDFLTMIKDYFDTVYAEGAEQPRIMCIALHPYMMGQAHRIGYLEQALDYILSHDGVWQATGEEIADWYYAEMWDEMTAHLALGGDNG
jgi:peptidoglycan/xylan/chitin deacetylase (PgdA/CDA1 family)